MKTIRCICPACGAKLDVDEDKKTLSCPYCGETILIDDETVHIKHDDMEQAGYEFEKGRQRAIKENSTKKTTNAKTKEDKDKSRNKVLLGLIVILLAIMFFPLIVTIYLVKEKKFQPKVRYVIIAACWIAWAPLAYTWIQNSDDTTAESKTAKEQTEEIADTTAPVISLNEDEITIQMSDDFDPTANFTISDDTTTEFVQIESEYSTKEKRKGWYVIDSKVDQERPSQTYLVKITAGDAAGNKTSANYSVKVIFDSYQGEVVEDDLLNQAMVQLSQDNMTSERITDIGAQLGLTVEENYIDGSLTEYSISNPNLNSGSIMCKICRNLESNYEPFMPIATFKLYGIEDESNCTIIITYVSSHSADQYANGSGYYIGEQYYGSFDEAYNAYLAMKN